MVTGAIGAVLSIVYWADWGGFGHRGSVIRQTDSTAPRGDLGLVVA